MDFDYDFKIRIINMTKISEKDDIIMNKKSAFTTLCYIENDDSYLMLHRVARENDINRDKWLGVGGHFEKGESPDECVLREVYEETGLTLTSYRLRGIITFVSDEQNVEYMFLYTADRFEGTMSTWCDEGILEWYKKSRIRELNLWEGDRIFFKLLGEREDVFTLKLVYEGDILKKAVLGSEEMELFDIVDESGEPTGKIRERSLVHAYGDLHRTAHIWIVNKTDNGKYKVLLQKRSKDKDSYPGNYDISSAGHIKAGYSYDESAIRELQEELGIEAKVTELKRVGLSRIKCKSVFYGKDFIDNEVSMVYIYDKMVDESKLVLQASEVESVKWIDYEECLSELKNGKKGYCVRMEEFLMIGRYLGIVD